ncbi:MAG: hypothetical protein LBP35_01260 [Candidatus Ancillula trichonymphae]|nr:hypothetical protein [Candidatus Ancillula trichonymphae]
MLSHVLQEQYNTTEYAKLEEFLGELEASSASSYNLVILDYAGAKNSSDIIKIRDISNYEDNPLLILVLSSSDKLTDKIESFDCGVDEYIVNHIVHLN